MNREFVRVAVLAAALSVVMLAAPPGAMPTEAAGPGTWTPVANGSMGHLSLGHDAALLPNGKILTAGLIDAPVSNIVDPTTNSWTSPATMGTIRMWLTLTLLRTGDVLMANGGASGILFAELYHPATNTWTFTGAQDTERPNASATLLSDGRVLAAGGGTFSGVWYATAELYDPATNSWSPAASMATARRNHGAVLLANGTVLVVGGDNSGGAVSSAELYDPVANTWSPAGSTASGQDGHTATLLPSGKVLVAGGTDAGVELATAEIYDPTSNTWSPVASMNGARTGAASALLGNGLVLVVGGRNGANALDTAELYDPVANAWTVTGTMATHREGATLTLVQDGRVVAIGNPSPGLGPFAEIYDPTRWRTVASPAVPRLNHTATLLQSGKVLVAGGGSADAELYDDATNTWSPAGTMSAPREGHAAALMKDGRVLVVGGSNGPNDGSNHLLTAEIYKPATNAWNPVANPALEHVGHSAVVLPDGRVFVYGAGFAATPEIYNPATDAWVVGANNTFAGLGGVAIRAGARVLSADLFTSSLYNPATDTWAAVSPYPGPSVPGTLAQLDGSNKIALTGGLELCPGPTTISTSVVELFDAVSLAWSTAAGMPGDRSSHSATGLYGGDLLIAGGSYQSACGGPSSSRSDAQLYHLATNVWTPAGSLTNARSLHTATRLSSGNVLIVGGTDGASAVASSELYDTGVNTDTDGDGYNDGLEVALGQHPFSKCDAMRADINYDGIVNSGDALRVAVEYGKRPPRARVDQNADKIINSGDQLRVAVNAGKRVLQCA